MLWLLPNLVGHHHLSEKGVVMSATDTPKSIEFPENPSIGINPDLKEGVDYVQLPAKSTMILTQTIDMGGFRVVVEVPSGLEIEEITISFADDQRNADFNWHAPKKDEPPCYEDSMYRSPLRMMRRR